MKYLQRSFTLPASESSVSQKKWDFAFMEKEEFISKYGVTDEQYEQYRKEL